MITDQPPVRIVVLNYNGAGRIERCIERLLETRYPDLRVTVVDNASSDGSPARVEQAFPEVDLIENGANLGFARGNNRALRVATEPYLGLLNPDTEVEPDWLHPLVARLNDDPLAGGAGAKLPASVRPTAREIDRPDVFAASARHAAVGCPVLRRGGRRRRGRRDRRRVWRGAQRVRPSVSLDRGER